MNTLTVSVLLAIASVSICSCNLVDEFHHSEYLDPDEKYRLYWSVDDLARSVKFVIEAKTTGWVGMGLSSHLTGASPKNDMVIGYVKAGNTYLEDCHEIGSSRPYLDTQQDYKMISGKEQNGNTTIIFRRNFTTSDSNDTDIQYGQTLKIIYAYGDTDNVYHVGEVKRGSKCINLFTAPIGSHCDQNTLEVSTNITKIQPGSLFQCQAFKLSDLIKGERHIVEIEPIFEAKHNDRIHYIGLYACSDNFNNSALNKVYPCYFKNTPLSIKTCAARSVFAIWAPSLKKESFKYPKHVGYPVGSEFDTKYIILETYFKSFKQTDSGVITGFRLHHEPPRQYSADVMTTGSRTAGSVVIPPGQSKWVSTAYCTKSCSEKIKHSRAINGNQVKIFAMFPYARIGATAVWAKMMNNGEEIRQIPRTDEGFGQQPIQLLKSEITWKAGDEIVTYCQYNTTEKKEAISGGPLMSQAMCLNFLWFYPRINFSSCISQDYRVYEKFSIKYAKPIYNTGFGIEYDKKKKALPQQYTNWTGVPWNADMIKELKDVYAYSGNDAIKQVCMQASSNGYMDYKTSKSKLRPDCPKGTTSMASSTLPMPLIFPITYALIKLISNLE